MFLVSPTQEGVRHPQEGARASKRTRWRPRQCVHLSMLLTFSLSHHVHLSSSTSFRLSHSTVSPHYSVLPGIHCHGLFSITLQCHVPQLTFVPAGLRIITYEGLVPYIYSSLIVSCRRWSVMHRGKPPLLTFNLTVSLRHCKVSYTYPSFRKTTTPWLQSENWDHD